MPSNQLAIARSKVMRKTDKKESLSKINILKVTQDYTIFIRKNS